MANKTITDAIFDSFSDTLFAELSNSEALSLQGFPGLVMGACLFLEVVTIIKLFNDGRDLKEILKSVATLMVTYTLVLWCFGAAKGVRSLADVANVNVPVIQGVNKGDPIREAHYILKHGFSKIADGIALSGSGSEVNSQKDVMTQVEIEALGLVACDREGDGLKQKCMKDFKKMETLEKAEEKYKEMTKCSSNSFGVPDFECLGAKYFQVSWFTLILIQVMSYVRVLLFNIVALLYVLTLTVTFVAFKMILPFAIWSKKRGDIIKASQDFFSTSLIAFLIKMISYIIGIIILGISSTSYASDNFAEILVVTILRASMVFIALLIEVVIYFKAPTMALSLFRLNISTFLEIGKAGIDALKIVGNLAGLAVGISAMAGGIYNSLVPKGIRDNIGKSLFGKSPSDGGGGDGGGGGFKPSSNFSSGDDRTSERSGQTSAQNTASEAPSQNANPSTGGDSSSGSSSGGNNNPSPKSQVDPNEFEAMLDKDLGTESGKNSEASTQKKSLWEKTKGMPASAYSGIKNASLSKMKDAATKGVSNTVGNAQWWKDAGMSAPSAAWGATKAVGRGALVGTGAALKASARLTGMGIQAGGFAYKALTPFASAGMSLVAGDSGKAMETMRNAGKEFKSYSESEAARAGDSLNQKIYSKDGSGARTENEYSKHFDDLRENEAFDTMKDNINRYEKGIEKTQTEMDGLDESDAEYEAKKNKIEAKMNYFQESAKKMKQELQEKEDLYKEEKKTKFEKYSDIDTDSDGKIDEAELIAFLDTSDELKSETLKNLAKKPKKGSELYFTKQKRDKAISTARSMISKDKVLFGGLSNKTVAFIEKNKDVFGPNALADINAEANSLKIKVAKNKKSGK